MPHSAAYGLVLNLAGIEMRDDGNSIVTMTREDLPELRLASGLITIPETGKLFQQLHSYPVGSTGKELAARARGSKFLISPVRREFLIGYDGLIGVETDDDSLKSVITANLEGVNNEPRYGLPFLGDNNFLIDQIDMLEEPLPAHWYTRQLSSKSGVVRSSRLTVNIDRIDNSKTISYLFAQSKTKEVYPPESAWTRVPSK
jgi:CRISPR-associated protein Cas5t